MKSKGSACAIQGCEMPVKGKGYCYMHLRRLQRHGDPLKTAKTPIGEPMRFLRETALYFSSDECLIWPFNKTGDGYPCIRHQGRPRRAHRILCELAHGAQPSVDSREVAHGCGKKLCVNPRHLRWATPTENQADKVLHGTTNRGERQWASKLTRKDVLAIRDMEGKMSRREIARIFGVQSSAIDKIHWRQRWNWL